MFIGTYTIIYNIAGQLAMFIGSARLMYAVINH